MVDAANHDELATKLLTLINVSASRSNNPKRIRLDAGDRPKLGKKKRVSTGSEGDAQRVEAELAPAEDKEDEGNDAEKKEAEPAPQKEPLAEDEDEEESKDTLYTHFGASPTRLTDENLSKAMEGRWSSKHTSNSFGRCTEYAVDDAKDNENVFISPKFAQGVDDSQLLKSLGSYKDVFCNHLSHAQNESMRKHLTLHIHNHLLRCVVGLFMLPN